MVPRMDALPRQKVLLSYFFLVTGIAVLFGLKVFDTTPFEPRKWAHLLIYPGAANVQVTLAAVFFAFLTLSPLLACALCEITAWGLKRDRRWSFWTGIAAGVLLLYGFPWFSMVGAGCLYLLLRNRASLELQRSGARSKEEFWNGRRGSLPQAIIALVGFLIALSSDGTLNAIANPTVDPPTGWDHMAVILVFLFVVLAIHESGHLAMAWALGCRIRAVAIGALLIENDFWGPSFHFDWKHPLRNVGYTTWVPSSPVHLRRTKIFTVASGPGASFLAGLVMLAVFFTMVSQGYRGQAWIASLLASLNFYCLVVSLIPIGVTDGKMLLHLILDTQRGQDLLRCIHDQWMFEEYNLAYWQADFERQAELSNRILLQALEEPQPEPARVAWAHFALGNAWLNADDARAGEIELRRCLENPQGWEHNPHLAASLHFGLCRAAVVRGHSADMQTAYAAAEAAIQAWGNPADPADQRGHVAALHLLAGSPEKALAEAEGALRALPTGRRSIIMRGYLQTQCAVANFDLGNVASGMEAFRRAEGIYRSAEIRPFQRHLASVHRAFLGYRTALGGQLEPGSRLLREAVEELKAHGAVMRALEYQIRLANLYRQFGLFDEGVAALPDDDSRIDAPHLRLALLSERAELHRLSDQLEAAAAEGRELLALWNSIPGAHTEAAIARAQMARILFDQGGTVAAGDLAEEALGVLEPWGHPDTADCLVTIGLARWKATGEWDSSYGERALAAIADDRTCFSAIKALLLAFEAARFHRAGLGEQTLIWRTHAAERWNKLGVQPVPSVPALGPAAGRAMPVTIGQ